MGLRRRSLSQSVQDVISACRLLLAAGQAEAGAGAAAGQRAAETSGGRRDRVEPHQLHRRAGEQMHAGLQPAAGLLPRRCRTTDDSGSTVQCDPHSPGTDASHCLLPSAGTHIPASASAKAAALVRGCTSPGAGAHVQVAAQLRGKGRHHQPALHRHLQARLPPLTQGLGTHTSCSPRLHQRHLRNVLPLLARLLHYVQITGHAEIALCSRCWL